MHDFFFFFLKQLELHFELILILHSLTREKNYIRSNSQKNKIKRRPKTYKLFNFKRMIFSSIPSEVFASNKKQKS